MNIENYLAKIKLPDPQSHKGQNGKLLVIGGSELFHASIFWSADVASRIVDMVHFSSPANENNQLVREKIKTNFWQGIVVDFTDIDTYIQEDDCVLIGPGMERSDATQKLVNQLLTKHPHKKWVVDGGALQMVDPKLLGTTTIITPHHRELQYLAANFEHLPVEQTNQDQVDRVLAELLNQGVTILQKGPIDYVLFGQEKIEIAGGNAGMTKGGTGDVLAGLVAALYCKNDGATSAAVGSYINKKAGEYLWEKVGPYFNASDLLAVIPEQLFRLLAK